MFGFLNHKKDFLKMLDDQAAKSSEGLGALVKFLDKPNEANSKIVKRFETEADELRRVLMDELNHAFVTAIDREDIYILSRAVDDVIDYAETTAEEMVLFKINKDEHIEKMVRLLHEAAQDIHLAIKNLQKHPEVSSEHLRRVRKAENSIEHIYRRALAELFESTDFRRVLKTREVYRHLSNAGDRAVEAANVLGSVLVKIS